MLRQKYHIHGSDVWHVKNKQLFALGLMPWVCVCLWGSALAWGEASPTISPAIEYQGTTKPPASSPYYAAVSKELREMQQKELAGVDASHNASTDRTKNPTKSVQKKGKKDPLRNVKGGKVTKAKDRVVTDGKSRMDKVALFFKAKIPFSPDLYVKQKLPPVAYWIQRQDTDKTQECYQKITDKKSWRIGAGVKTASEYKGVFSENSQLFGNIVYLRQAVQENNSFVMKALAQFTDVLDTLNHKYNEAMKAYDDKKKSLSTKRWRATITGMKIAGGLSALGLGIAAANSAEEGTGLEDVLGVLADNQMQQHNIAQGIKESGVIEAVESQASGGGGTPSTGGNGLLSSPSVAGG